MKKLLILSAIFFSYIHLSTAQAYRPFLNDSAHWTILEQFCIGPCDPGDPNNPSNYNYSNIIQLKIDGDTVVNGSVFKKITQNLHRIGRSGPYDPGYFPCNTLGVLWEDTNARKVYIQKVNEPYANQWCIQDSVLFDFSRNVSDSMNWSTSCNDDSFFVDSISNSTIIFNPSQLGIQGGIHQYTAKTWYLGPNGYFGGFELYESIGASLGFWGSLPSFEGSYESRLIEYCIGNDSACEFICGPPLGINNATTSTFSTSVYPNPAKGTLILDMMNMSPDDNLRFAVTDIVGQEVHSESITKAKTEIDISTFSSGIYIWHLVSDGNIIRYGKVVHE